MQRQKKGFQEGAEMMSNYTGIFHRRCMHAQGLAVAQLGTAALSESLTKLASFTSCMRPCNE